MKVMTSCPQIFVFIATCTGDIGELAFKAIFVCRFQYIVYLDHDEMFVPTMNRKWGEMMEELVTRPQIMVAEKAVGFSKFTQQVIDSRMKNKRVGPPEDVANWRLSQYLFLGSWKVPAEVSVPYTHMMNTTLR